MKDALYNLVGRVVKADIKGNPTDVLVCDNALTDDYAIITGVRRVEFSHTDVVEIIPGSTYREIPATLRFNREV